MSHIMNQAAVTMNQLQQKLDIIGNNMANSQTTGYKSRQAEFSSLLFSQINNLSARENAEGRLTPDGIRIGSGAKIGSVGNDLTLGSISETGRALDAALTRENYLFQIQVDQNGQNETLYTRDGSFFLSPVNNNEAVMLTTGDGHPVLGQDGPIVLSDGFDSIALRENGQIVVTRGGQDAVEAQVQVVQAIRPTILEAAGENMLRLPDLNNLGYEMNEIIEEVGVNENMIQSGALEQSNVDLSKQMTDLIMTQRSYQFNARTISMGDQMMGLVNQLRS
ncbi:flagellar hook-basal body protein [Oceanobacillus sp. FSL K6-2867]|uniref:flagellar hook-basal body protein n=1 Tax=Oceanobacillus sp. FSL K6-2867 TaxID=2954748 RepID=UPI0030D9673F